MFENKKKYNLVANIKVKNIKAENTVMAPSSSFHIDLGFRLIFISPFFTISRPLQEGQ